MLYASLYIVRIEMSSDKIWCMTYDIEVHGAVTCNVILRNVILQCITLFYII